MPLFDTLSEKSAIKRLNIADFLFSKLKIEFYYDRTRISTAGMATV